MAVPERRHWRPEKLMPAALNSLINLDEPLHREMRMQQSDFFFLLTLRPFATKSHLR